MDKDRQLKLYFSNKIATLNGKIWPGLYTKNVKHTLTSEVMWQLMALRSNGIAKIAIYSLLQSHSQ